MGEKEIRLELGFLALHTEGVKCGHKACRNLIKAVRELHAKYPEFSTDYGFTQEQEARISEDGIRAARIDSIPER